MKKTELGALIIILTTIISIIIYALIVLPSPYLIGLGIVILFVASLCGLVIGMIVSIDFLVDCGWNEAIAGTYSCIVFFSLILIVGILLGVLK